jgi:hypothetical protein
MIASDDDSEYDACALTLGTLAANLHPRIPCRDLARHLGTFIRGAIVDDEEADVNAFLVVQDAADGLLQVVA